MKKSISFVMVVLTVIFLSACKRESDYQLKLDNKYRFEELVFLTKNTLDSPFLTSLSVDGEEGLFLVRFYDKDDTPYIKKVEVKFNGEWTKPIYFGELMQGDARFGATISATFDGLIYEARLSGLQSGLFSSNYYDLELMEGSNLIRIGDQYTQRFSYGIDDERMYTNGEITLEVLELDDITPISESHVSYLGDDLYWYPDFFDFNEAVLIEEDSTVLSAMIYKGRYGLYMISVIDSLNQIRQFDKNNQIFTDALDLGSNVIEQNLAFDYFMPEEVPVVLVETELEFIFLDEYQTQVTRIVKPELMIGYHTYVTRDGGYIAIYTLVDDKIVRDKILVVDFKNL